MAASSMFKTIDVKTVPTEALDKKPEKKEVKWDPMIAPEWDTEKPSNLALVRMKRYTNKCSSDLYTSLQLCKTYACRDLHNVFTDPPPGIFVVPTGDDISRVR